MHLEILMIRSVTYKFNPQHLLHVTFLPFVSPITTQVMKESNVLTLENKKEKEKKGTSVD